MDKVDREMICLHLCESEVYFSDCQAFLIMRIE